MQVELQRRRETLLAELADLDRRLAAVACTSGSKSAANASRLQHKQQLELVGRLLPGVAHEISNPLHGIMNYGDLICQDTDPDSRIHDWAEGIVRESHRIGRLLDDLRDLARTGDEVDVPEGPGELIACSLRLVMSTLRRHQIEVHVQVPPELPTVSCRGRQIRQVLLSLIDNARDALQVRYPDYDPDKQLSIIAAPFERQGRTWVRLTVEDHGAGLTAAQMEHASEPILSSGSNAPTTGLGLSVSKRIAEEHGGVLRLEPRPGGGMRAHFELPAQEIQSCRG